MGSYCYCEQATFVLVVPQKNVQSRSMEVIVEGPASDEIWL
jgi:hypothetical protein